MILYFQISASKIICTFHLNFWCDFLSHILGKLVSWRPLVRSNYLHELLTRTIGVFDVLLYLKWFICRDELKKTSILQVKRHHSKHGWSIREFTSLNLMLLKYSMTTRQREGWEQKWTTGCHKSGWLNLSFPTLWLGETRAHNKNHISNLYLNLLSCKIHGGWYYFIKHSTIDVNQSETSRRSVNDHHTLCCCEIMFMVLKSFLDFNLEWWVY